MKKLLIAAALTASVCSFGANINATGFESTDTPFADDVKFFSEGDGDASAVTAYADDAAPSLTTAYGAAGSNYLNLSTEGTTLWRLIDPGEGQVGTYIDTLVQFTATEEDPTTFDNDAKFAMWLKSSTEGDVTTYALKVMGSAVTLDDSGFETATKTVYQLNASVEPSTWYRLTVKTVKIFEEATYMQNGYGFAVYIDGAPVAVVSGQKVFSNEALEALSTGDSNYLSASVKAALAENTLIPSIGVLTAETDINGVGFKGTGAIDSIAWTDDELFQEVPVGFTLTVAFGDGVTAAEYTIGEAAAVAVTNGGKYTFNSGDEVVFSATVADWYVANSADKTVTVTKDDTVTLTATAVTASDANVVVPENSAVSADAVFAWAKGIEGVDLADVQGAKNIFNNYILNVANLAVDPQIEIVSIDTTVNPVAVTAKVTDANGSSYEKVLEASDLQGASLWYKAASTLEGLKSAQKKAAIEQGDQFIKVVVE